MASRPLATVGTSLSGMTDGDEVPALPGYIDIGHQYSRAPIIEATIDLRVDSGDTGAPLVDEEHFAKLSQIYSSGDAGFEAPTPLYTFSSKLTVDDGDTIVGRAPGRQIGFTFRKQDGSAVIRANIDRYAYTRLTPYTDWDDFLKDAEASWTLYRDAVSPSQVVTVGVRFVNRIVVPKTIIEIRDYLRATVDVPPYLPQWTTGYFLQVGIPLEEFDAEALVITALGDREEGEEDCTILILDIDVRSQVRLDVSGDNFDAALLAKLAKLRVAKNFVFEACITDATRGLLG